MPISHKLLSTTLKAALRVLTYLNCTMNFELVYKITPDVQPLETFIDSDWG